jgi:hypothetical protein
VDFALLLMLIMHPPGSASNYSHPFFQLFPVITQEMNVFDVMRLNAAKESALFLSILFFIMCYLNMQSGLLPRFSNR